MTTPRKQQIASHRISAALLTTVIALATGGSVGAAPAHSAEAKQCGSITHGQQREFAIKARGVSCATARRMTKQWTINVNRLSAACNCSVYRRVIVRGFVCLAPSSKLDRLVDCRRPGARVSWHQGLLLGHCAYTRSCGTSQPIGGGTPRV